MFKTISPLKDFAKKVKRQSLMLSRSNVDKRSTTIGDSVVLDEDFLAKLRSIPDDDADKCIVSNKFMCFECKENRENEKIGIYSCLHVFHPSCLVHNLLLHKNVNEIIESTKCPICDIQLDVSDMMFIYADMCTKVNTDIQKNEYRIEELKNQIGNIQTEFALINNNINKVSKQREISKGIMATVVTMTQS